MKSHFDIGCFVEKLKESDSPCGGEDSRTGNRESLKRIPVCAPERRRGWEEKCKTLGMCYSAAFDDKGDG